MQSQAPPNEQPNEQKTNPAAIATPITSAIPQTSTQPNGHTNGSSTSQTNQPTITAATTATAEGRPSTSLPTNPLASSPGLPGEVSRSDGGGLSSLPLPTSHLHPSLFPPSLLHLPPSPILMGEGWGEGFLTSPLPTNPLSFFLFPQSPSSQCPLCPLW